MHLTQSLPTSPIALARTEDLTAVELREFIAGDDPPADADP
ncbi:unnamed protein product, partial [marine sediment metagenome]